MRGIETNHRQWFHDPLLKETDVAEMLSLSVQSIRRLRAAGSGPPFIRIRGAVRYLPSDVRGWLASRSRCGSSDESIPSNSALEVQQAGTAARI